MEQSGDSRAIFISYASEDAEVAAAIARALRAKGAEVWLDKDELRGGDAWHRKIGEQIRRCWLFLAIISAQTEARDEGYFRREWRLAVDRMHDMAEHKRFLVPVAIDDISERTAAVPDRFREVQWIRLKPAAITPAFVDYITGLVASGDAASGLTSTSPSAQKDVPSRQRPRFSLRLALGLPIAVGLAAGGGWLAYRDTGSHKPPPAPAPATSVGSSFAPPAHSVAVLPFSNLSDDPKQEYFCDGMAEELLDSLARVRDLQVAARTSSFAFKGKTVETGVIAHTLNVGYLVEGSVRKSGKMVRVAVQLIDARTGYHVWSQTYDRQLSDVLKVESELAGTLVYALEGKLGGLPELQSGGTENADAYDAYLQGKQLLNAGHSLPGALVKMDEAIALDPRYAKAYAARAWILHSIATGTKDTAERAEQRQQARLAAQRATDLAPDWGEGHAILASIKAYALFDYRGAAPEFEKALALEPGSAMVQATYAFYTADLGRVDASIAAARRAVVLDPQNAWMHDVLSSVYSYAHRYDEALRALNDASALHPTWPAPNSSRAQLYLAAGQTDRARELCEPPSSPMDADDRHYCLSLLYHVTGRPADAKHELDQFIAADGDLGAGYYAAVYAQWGQPERAMAWLQKAERAHDRILWTLAVDWHFDPIRENPDFKALQKRIDLPM